MIQVGGLPFSSVGFFKPQKNFQTQHVSNVEWPTSRRLMERVGTATKIYPNLHVLLRGLGTGEIQTKLNAKPCLFVKQ